MIEAEQERARIVNRRFGKRFSKPCARKDVLECAYWECQVHNMCQYAIERNEHGGGE